MPLLLSGLFILVLFTSFEADAQPRVELLTVEPGPRLWERFGHTAVRVREGDSDLVFSFGAAPFLEPRFVWSFARGEGEFFVVAQPFAAVLASYRAADRTLQSQHLLLSEAGRAQLAAQLAAAVKPPHNRYRYDQLYDNCATRVRDLIDRASGGALTRAARMRYPRRKYRDYTLQAMAGHAIGHWALDLLGGPHQDLPVSGYHEMFLPVHLRDRVAEARTGSLELPLAQPVQTLLTRRGAPLSRDVWRARRIMLALAFAFCAMALAGLAVRGRAGQMARLSAAGCALLALWSSLFGMLVVPLALFSRVHNFSPNENAWLFLPSDALCVAPLFYRVRPGTRLDRVIKFYVGARLLGLLALLALKLNARLTQDNWVFVAIAALFVLSAASLAFSQGAATPGARGDAL